MGHHIEPYRYRISAETSRLTLQVPRFCLWLENANHQKHIGQVGSTEFEMAWIDPAVMHLQEFGCPTGIPARPWWANDQAAAHLQAKTVPYNLRWHELAQWLGVTTSGRIWVPIGNSCRDPMGQSPWRGTPMGTDGSIELLMAWIDLKVVELQHLQEFGCLMAMPAWEWQIDQWPHHCTSKGQATGLDAWASRVKCPARFVSHLHDICIYMSCS